MIRTGVFATEEQIQRMKDAQSQPYIVGTGGVPPRGPLEVAHDCAKEQGLPEIQGYYGCDLSNGEFVSA